MANFVIFTESTTDFSPEMINELGLIVLPLQYRIGEDTYFDKVGGGLSIVEFYNKLRQGESATTAQVNPGAFEDEFEKVLKEGKDILYIGFSSGLSGTYNSSLIAKDALQDKYPDRKIICIDSLCASMGEGLYVWYAAKMRDEGKSIEEAANWLEENKLNLCHWFTVDDLNHLKRGGRVSPTVAFVGTLLGIKPVLHVDNEGHLINVSKVRGRKAALDALVAKFKETAIRPDQTVFISHGDCLEDACYVGEEIKKLGATNVEISFIGPVIGAHAGPGTVALFFLGSER